MTYSLPSFDQLMELAQSNPSMLEDLRQNAIDEVITSAPGYMQQRLRGLQFQIDCQRKLHKNPLGSCLAMSKMMHESLSKLHKSLNGEIDSVNIGTSQNATILSFPQAEAS